MRYIRSKRGGEAKVGVFKEMMINFAILGAYLFLATPALFAYGGDKPKRTLAFKLAVGVCFGALGIVLLFFSINVNAHTPLNMRGIAVMLAAYFGGPIGALSEVAVVYVGRWIKDGPIEAVQLAVGSTAALGTGAIFSAVRPYVFKWAAGASFLLVYYYFGLWLLGDLSLRMVQNYMLYQAGYAALIAALLYSILQNQETKRLVKRTERDKLELLRMQPGFVFRFEKRADGRYYYTLIEGRLLARIGAVPADFIGKPVEDVRIFDEAYVRLLNGQYDLAWGGEEQSHEQPFLDVVLLITLHPIRRDGVVTDVVGTGLDITEMKKREEADASNRAKSRFLAQMSHEIRTPINAIIGLNHILRQTELTERQQDYVGKSLTAAKSLLAIVNDVLDFSKIEAGKATLERIEFDLYEVLHNVSNLVGFRATEKGLKFRYDIRRDVPQMLVGDPFRLQQILLNVTNNAVKFTSEGELSISVRTEGSRTDRRRIVFAVRDTGIGMSKEQTGRLFREFTQGDMTTTRKYGGTGLGLVISRRFAELMGGAIEVESELGRGSTFTIVLPLSPAETGACARIGERSLGVVRTLLVCADSEMRHVLRRQLEGLTLAVDVAERADEAMDKLEREGPYALALLDWRLEDEEPMRLAERIRERQPGGHPAIVIVSASHEPALQAASESSRVAKTLLFPISQSRLYDELVELVALQPLRAAGGDGGARSEYASLKDAVVLLAEDNEINQLVARELLHGVVARVDVASDGGEAVRLVEATRYDAILMDLQMPEMDGYEATRRIRRLANGKGVPIVAMTADAMKGVEEQALEIGMNAYITKPFDPVELYRALQRFVRRTARTERTTEDGVPDSAAWLVAASAEAPVRSPLDRMGALARLGGNANVYARVLRLFASDHAGDVGRIREALAAGDRQRAELLAHSLKGVAANIGATDLAAFAAELQAASRDAGREATAKLLARAEAEMRAVVREVNEEGIEA